jgi:hypothetical protein
MPFYPFYALLAATAIHPLVLAVRRGIQAQPESLLSPGRAASLVVALLIALPLRTIAVVHPWEMSYYNALIGGTSGADRRGMEVTYWGDTYMRAISWLGEHAPPNSTVWIEPVGMLSLCQWSKSGMVRDDIHLIGGPWTDPPPDFVVFQNKVTEWTPVARALLATGEPKYAERLDGVPVFFVYDSEAISRITLPASVTVAPRTP